MFNIVQHRKWFFLFSGFVILAGIISMIISISTYPEHSPVRLSIDFRGGTLFEFQFLGDKPTSEITGEMIDAKFIEAGVTEVRHQRLGQDAENRWQVRSDYLNDAGTKKVESLLADLAKTAGMDYKTLRSTTVSPTVGSQVTTAALIAVIVASIAVLGWIAFAFRGVTDSWRYGTCAVLAMIHDVLVMAGVMSIMGLVFGWEADSLFLTGLLTVVGYSVQDTIVVFDRIRENAARHRGEPYEMIINRSILETLQRSIAMQLVVGFVLIALFLIGGETIRQFVGILLIGLLSGTYSSTFTAIPLLVAWDHGQLPLISRRPANA